VVNGLRDPKNTASGAQIIVEVTTYSLKCELLHSTVLGLEKMNVVLALRTQSCASSATSYLAKHCYVSCI
jgi:hypothetical protein